MPSNPEPPASPSRDEVAARLRGLVTGERSPQEADEWASQWVVAEDAGVEDPVVWLGLTQLAGASARVNESELLYGDADYRKWLARFEDARRANDERKYFWRVWQEAEVRLRNAVDHLSDGRVAVDALHYLEHNEYGLALETLVERVEEAGLEPPTDFWLACSDAAEVMGQHEMCRELRRRAVGW
jgi:hypothetical protein